MTVNTLENPAELMHPFGAGRRFAAGRGGLASKDAPVHAFAVIWAAGVLAPIAISVFYSLLRAHGLRIQWVVSLQAYRDIIESSRWDVIVRTITAAAIVTAISLAAGFPFALWLAK